MKSARHQLILLGLICQGLSWDNVVAPLVYALLWGACFVRPPRPTRFGQALDISAIALGSVLAWQAAPVFGASAHFAIGHGLALLQLLRLRRRWSGGKSSSRSSSPLGISRSPAR